jgi:hypothetical protein
VSVVETRPIALDTLYAGARYLLAPSAGSRALAAHVRAAVAEAFGGADYRDRAARLAPEALFAQVGAIRRWMFEDLALRRLLFACAAGEGLDVTRLAIDAPRLRCIVPGGHHEPRARAVYVAHRDTWYGHPPALVTWWIPLDALAPDETFVFYPSLFDARVANDSAAFDYARWTAGGDALRIGWQDRDAGLRETYPASAAPDAPAEGFGCEADALLLFAGAHLHRTLPRDAGRPRFSFDFRVVDVEDARAGRGAPSVDDASRGSALRDYWRHDGRAAGVVP